MREPGQRVTGLVIWPSSHRMASAISGFRCTAARLLWNPGRTQRKGNRAGGSLRVNRSGRRQ